jgi:hypothetical protein
MKKCVSCSLFIPANTNNKYADTYLSIPLTMHFLPNDFDLVIYYDESVPQYMIEEYKKFKFIKLIKKPLSIVRTGCFWRYEAYDEYDLCLFRDIDICLENNDKIILEDFLIKENNIFWVFLVHTRKVYPKQGFVMGGVFGLRKTSNIKSMAELLDSWKNKDHYGSDEEFLSLIIYPIEKPICYYEPRDNCKNTVIINKQFETYIELAANYELKKYN